MYRFDVTFNTRETVRIRVKVNGAILCPRPYVRLGDERGGLSGVCVVALHVGLQVKVGHLVVLFGLEKGLQFGVGANDALVLGILQPMFLDVLVDMLNHFSTRHFCAHVFANELAQFRRDVARLGDATHRAVATRLLLLLGNRGLTGQNANVFCILLLDRREFLRQTAKLRGELADGRLQGLDARNDTRTVACSVWDRGRNRCGLCHRDGCLGDRGRHHLGLGLGGCLGRRLGLGGLGLGRGDFGRGHLDKEGE